MSNKPFIVDINGIQVFSSDFVFEQMQAQNRRIDRAKAIAKISLGIAIVSLVTCWIILLVR